MPGVTGDEDRKESSSATFRSAEPPAPLRAKSREPRSLSRPGLIYVQPHLVGREGLAPKEILVTTHSPDSGLDHLDPRRSESRIQGHLVK